MFLKSISLFLALIFIGCGFKGGEVYVPKSAAPTQKKLKIIIVNRLNPPWVIGKIGDKPVTVSSDIGNYIKAKFLKLIKKRVKAQIVVDIKKFWIQEFKSKIYGYAYVEVTYRFKNAIYVKKIEIKRLDSKDIEKMVQNMLDEIVSIMKESYEMYFMQ